MEYFEGSVKPLSEFFPPPRRPCDMPGTINVFLTTIHRLDHDLMQLLKTSEKEKVMYNVASNLNGIFAPAGFWPRGQNLRRHHCSPRVYTVYIYSIPDKISICPKWASK